MPEAPTSLLLLGAGGTTAASAAYRRDPLASIAAAYPVVLADAEAPDWARPYLTDHITVDLADTEATATAVKAYAAHHDLSGVLTYMENHVVTAALLAQQLGLPGTSPQSMEACRDKSTTRYLLDVHGVPSARAVLADNAEAAVAWAVAHGFPVMVKPRAQAGSAGVMRANTPSEVRDAFERASHETVLGLDAYGPHGVLVEEFLDGPEISVEAAVLGPGESRIIAVTRKTVGPPPTAQEYGHCVDARDPLLTDPELAHLITTAVNAVGVTRGTLCIEVMLTARGPRIVEINGRIGGDLLHVLINEALGLDLARIAADIATGARPQLAHTRELSAAIQFLYPDQAGVVQRLTLPSQLTEQPWVERLETTAEPGAHVAAPPAATYGDRLAHWIVRGTGPAQCASRLSQVEGGVELHIASSTRAATQATVALTDVKALAAPSTPPLAAP
ncbi:MAG TPA: ATP-grasp domain-containing protein [Streptomyces sp.]|uniref:ATP-grasp domain-containing protein n=1 Tax=Streptomyces sp. TaxID=1931 RepID=UPI002CEBC104|nr:ATP-grasp domain-containing protein [Streptomyces sp.]HWU06068.1 ATP-grasp domain-containing protein [Streptomyces sp.]